MAAAARRREVTLSNCNGNDCHWNIVLWLRGSNVEDRESMSHIRLWGLC